MKQSFRNRSALHHLGILGKELKAGTWKQKLKRGPWSRGSQPVGRPIWRSKNSFTGVACDHRKAQIFPLWPTTVTKLQLQSCSENNFMSGGHHNTRNWMRKVENRCPRRTWFTTGLLNLLSYGTWPTCLGLALPPPPRGSSHINHQSRNGLTDIFILVRCFLGRLSVFLDDSNLGQVDHTLTSPAP